MEIDLTINGVAIHVSGVDEPGAVLSPRFASQADHISEALGRLPIAHLRHVPPIVVGNRPASGGGFYRTPPHIGLNFRTFGASHNVNQLFTLLHECGHAVDRATHAVAAFARQCGGDLVIGAPGNADWDAYRAIAYGGRNRRADGTPAFGEHFAEGYAILLTHPSRITGAQQRIIRAMAGL